ncbi:unnamed protein product [Cuscuta campestris]|uniref:Uncharacterized protein n=1 Tax=Cuscuta campestris TaxID=132261 RepID=A0A484NMK9_9ASTE|nr:unnamed protein product [Cuscuta campestris]
MNMPNEFQMLKDLLEEKKLDWILMCLEERSNYEKLRNIKHILHVLVSSNSMAKLVTQGNCRHESACDAVDHSLLNRIILKRVDWGMRFCGI